MEEERLCQKINDLKKDIQWIIEKDKGEPGKFEDEKKVKMALLKGLTQKLKDMKTKKAEINKAQSAVNSLEYHAANRKGKDSAGVQKFRLAREAREKAKNEYFDYLKLEERYTEVDPKEVPGPLFLHEAVLNAYGYCPYIDIDFEVEDPGGRIMGQRQKWLEEKEDKGKVYYDLFEDLYNKRGLVEAEASKAAHVGRMEAKIKLHLTDPQWDLYMQSMEIIKEWMTCNVRTKKIKERFKGLTHNMSVLYAETLMPIHDYLGLEYLSNHPSGIMVNDVKLTKEAMQRTDLYVAETFRGDIEELKKLRELLDGKRKWIINTTKNLKHELYLFLTKSNDKQYRQKPKFVHQIGKYFRRWTALTVEEKAERFASFSKYYVTRYMVAELLIEEAQQEKYITNLTELLSEAYRKKELIYRDFAWVTKHGMIEKVKVLKYNKETDQFFLDSHHKAAKLAKQQQPSKKKASSRTIFTKENERVINEQILMWVVKDIHNNTSGGVGGGGKEQFLEKVKDQLRVKRISNGDKATLYKKFDEMYIVVKNSHRSEGVTVNAVNVS